jgi:methionine-rich copper-binding protein CopC
MRFATTHRGLAHRVTSLLRSNSAAFGAKPTWKLTDQNLWIHALVTCPLQQRIVPMKLLAAALSSLLLIVSAPVARAHASLSHASPSEGSALSAGPQEVTLTFTDTLEAAFSKLTVIDSNGTEVSQGKAQANGNVMRVSLRPLSAGIYKVNWLAVSTDTHRTEGNFTFSVH